MKHLFVSLVLLAATTWPGLPYMEGYHYNLDPDGVRRWYWYQVTPRDAPEGWVADAKTGQRVWWRWVDGRVRIWRTR